MPDPRTPPAEPRPDPRRGAGLRGAAVTVAVAAVPTLVLLAVRPGVVLNALRSPVAWLVVVGVTLLGLGVRALLQRGGVRPSVAGWAARAVVLGIVGVLLAPSFQQRTLVEELPGAEAASLTAAAPLSTKPPTPAAPAPPTTAPSPRTRETSTTAAAPPPRAEPAPPAAVSRTAELEGIGHSARGRVHLRTVDGVGYVVLDDVDIEGTVDPSVHLVPDGGRTPGGGGLRLGALKAEKGSFSYRLPASVDLSRSWSVLVWCDPYDTPIAAADPR